MISADSNQGAAMRGQAHHEDGADGEVGRHDGVGPLAVEQAGEVLQVAVGQPGGADHGVDAVDARTTAGWPGPPSTLVKSTATCGVGLLHRRAEHRRA